MFYVAVGQNLWAVQSWPTTLASQDCFNMTRWAQEGDSPIYTSPIIRCLLLLLQLMTSLPCGFQLHYLLNRRSNAMWPSLLSLFLQQARIYQCITSELTYFIFPHISNVTNACNSVNPPVTRDIISKLIRHIGSRFPLYKMIQQGIFLKPYSPDQFCCLLVKYNLIVLG